MKKTVKGIILLLAMILVLLVSQSCELFSNNAYVTIENNSSVDIGSITIKSGYQIEIGDTDFVYEYEQDAAGIVNSGDTELVTIQVSSNGDGFMEAIGIEFTFDGVTYSTGKGYLYYSDSGDNDDIAITISDSSTDVFSIAIDTYGWR